MADETKVETPAVAEVVAEAPAKAAEAQAEGAAEAPAKVAEAVAETVKTVARDSAKAADKVAKVAGESPKAVSKSGKVAKRPRAAVVRRAKRQAVVKKSAPHRAARKTVTAVRKKAAPANKRIETMIKNAFNIDAIPALAPFQTILTEANERGQELVKRSQKVAEELADLARANVEAVVEAGRVASEGARTIGQDVVAKQRDSFEQAADAIRSLAEAKSPTEYLQLQGDFARASFDRAVAETSKLTESLVKLAGEAFQPLSTRASANAERFNTLVA